MFSARYLIRLDDACPTMATERWLKFEELFDRFSIRPIVAVIPDNQDRAMVFDEPDALFWDRVCRWQDKGWEIALHGHTHVMEATKARQVLPFYDRSEFSGLPYEEQKRKLLTGVEILKTHDIRVRTFIAPGHCFDSVTVRVLANETDISIISDGIALKAYFEKGLHWIPQQLSEFGKKPFGLWTICLHPNTCDEATLFALQKAFEEQRESFVTIDGLGLNTRRGKSIFDDVYRLRFWYKRQRLGKFLFNLA
jgi:hypothetical protein